MWLSVYHERQADIGDGREGIGREEERVERGDRMIKEEEENKRRVEEEEKVERGDRMIKEEEEKKRRVEVYRESKRMGEDEK